MMRRSTMNSETDTAKPSVSGISPYEGPPGTKVTIRGHHLGKDAKDILSVTICGIDCTKKAIYYSQSKIFCIVDGIEIVQPLSGPVIVTTQSGGIGECSINFNIVYTKLSPFTISSVWIEEDVESLIPGRIDILDQSQTGSNQCEADPLSILPTNTYSSGPPIVTQGLIKYSSKLVDHNFHPVKFLLERHSTTTWENLKKGFQAMQQGLNIQSSADLKHSSSCPTNDVPVVINVISDMHKLSKLMNERRFTISEELNKKMESLKKIIENNFIQISSGYTLMISRIRFLDLYKTNEDIATIPNRVKHCIQTAGNYSHLISSCIKFYQLDRSQHHRLESLLNTIDGSISVFLNQIIDNLISLYPVHFISIFEFLKTIESFRDKTNHTLLVLKNHQTWVSFKLESIRDSFTKTIMKQNYYVDAFHSQNKHLLDFTENITLFVVKYCSFFSREFNVAENIFYSNNTAFRKSVQSFTNNNKTISDLIFVDDIYCKHIDLFFDTLKTLLFYHWSVLSIHPSQKEIYCSVTSFNVNQLVQVFNTLTYFAVNIKQSKVLELALFLNSDKTVDKFTFTFTKQFSSKFHNLLFDTLQILKKYYIAQLSQVLNFPSNYDPTTYRWKDTFDIPLSVYSIYHDWVMIIFQLFNTIKSANVLESTLSTRFETNYPRNVLIGIIREKISTYMESKRFSSYPYTISFYSYLLTVKSNILEKLTTKNIITGTYEHAPFTQASLLENIKSNLVDIEKNMNENILVRACELLLTPTIKIIKGQYLSNLDNFSPTNFYLTIIDILLLCKKSCITMHKDVYPHTINIVTSLFATYIGKAFTGINLNNNIAMKLYKNVVVIREIVNIIQPSSVSLYDKLLPTLEPSLIDKALIQKKAEDITQQQRYKLKILAVN